MNPNCARCGKIVYPTEKVNCLDKFWHKACFHCETCKMTLNMKNYKGYEKKPYCNAHYPKQSFTMVADTPENLRLKQQSELQSQVRYKEEFEKNKGKGFSVVADTPELQRIKKTQDQISNIKYHEEFEKSRMGPSGGEGMEPERRDSQESSSYRRPPEQQQPHHIPTSAPGECRACWCRPHKARLVGWGGSQREDRQTDTPSGALLLINRQLSLSCARGDRGPEAGPAGVRRKPARDRHTHAHTHTHACRLGKDCFPSPQVPFSSRMRA
uniref:LIM and SH3 domain protein 1 n=1 Tax=Piliocolobus tephrosceles TaxID=591936 RepID=A0A8C9HFT1_9PRIM